MNGITAVTLQERELIVQFKGGLSIKFEDFWLRDHCRCSTCYHADTFQRAQNILDIPDVKINKFDFNKSELRILWDDKHESIFKDDFLIQFDYNTWFESRRLKPILWRGDDVIEKICRVPVDKFLSSTKVTKSVFQSLLNYGVALIDGVEPTVEATERICEALGGVQYTMFGGMWTVVANAERADTAYTSLPLAAHNDNTYFTEAAGLQIFHCLEHSKGNGGETVLIDGFYVATRLKEEHPADYEFLTTYNVEAEYLDDEHHYRHSSPVIQIDSDTKEIKQVRFNIYDRSPMAFPDRETCKSYYRSLRNLARYFSEPVNQWQFKLQPGSVIAIDNFRVLHGRTEFTGNRLLCGSYVKRADWLNKARKLELIH